jgi:hypothetical protein
MFFLVKFFPDKRQISDDLALFISQKNWPAQAANRANQTNPIPK